MIMTKQPNYNKSTNKFYARTSNQDIYHYLRNERKIAANQTYYTLCHRQDLSPGCELVQYEKTKFLKKPQFFGIDNDDELNEKNRKDHPEANFITGDWSSVIMQQEIFNPGMVYLDTIHFLHTPVAAKMLLRTMLRCKARTLIVANFLANNPRKGNKGGDLFDENLLFKNMFENEHPNLFKDWNIDKRKNKFCCVSYLYTTNKAKMRSYVFYRGQIDSKDLIEYLCS